MTKSQNNCTWLDKIYQPQSFQTTIFTGFDFRKINPLAIVINDFVNSMDFSFFKQYYHSNNIQGGRPPYNYKTLFKIYIYMLYNNISINKLNEFYSLGSNLHFLSQELKKLPSREVFTNFLKVLDNHIDEIFILHLKYISNFIKLDYKNLYGDGTIFEAHNNRHKIITDTNINRSNTKWNNVLNNCNSTDEIKELAKSKLKLNKERAKKLEELQRTSYGRTDEDCVILKDKNGSFIAGYNVQFIEENNYGIIVYNYISNKNPDSTAFLEIIEPLIQKYHPKTITLDTGYGTPEIIQKLQNLGVVVIVKALKNENSKLMINEYSFELSDNEEYLICPVGQILQKSKINDNESITFRANNCNLCERKKECVKRGKNKSITIKIKEFKAMKIADQVINSDRGKKSYSYRGNKCESPHGFIKHNLNGKKLKMIGLKRNHTVVTLYSMLYNFRRLISVKLNDDKNSD